MGRCVVFVSGSGLALAWGSLSLAGVVVAGVCLVVVALRLRAAALWSACGVVVGVRCVVVAFRLRATALWSGFLLRKSGLERSSPSCSGLKTSRGEKSVCSFSSADFRKIAFLKTAFKTAPKKKLRLVPQTAFLTFLSSKPHYNLAISGDFFTEKRSRRLLSKREILSLSSVDAAGRFFVKK